MSDRVTSHIELFNQRVMRRVGVSRSEKFENSERERLLPLPEQPYEFGLWKTAKVHPDCHIQVQTNFYSVPHGLRGGQVEVRVTESLVEVYKSLDRVACHVRTSRHARGIYSTLKRHLPDAHQALLEDGPTRALSHAEDVGDHTSLVVSRLINEARHPLMYLRRVQGILRLEKRYSRKALEEACGQVSGLSTLMPRLKDIEQIIKSNLSPTSATVHALYRQKNPYLRGQSTWTQNESSELGEH